MIRTATVSLKFATEEKKELIENLAAEYQRVVQQYINLLWESPSLQLNKETLALVQDTSLSERYKSNALRQAIQICTNTKKSAEALGKIPTRPDFNGTMLLDAKFVDIRIDMPNSFDGWIRLSILDKGNRIWVPFKRTRPLNKWLSKGFELKSSIRLRKYNGNWYVDLTLEKEESPTKIEGSFLGIDSGTRKALSLSDGSHLGEIYRYYIDKINRKQRGSRNYIQALRERDNYLREEINKINFASTRVIFVENIKGIQRNTKKNKRVGKSTRKILSTWVQGKTFRWLQNKCEENCVGFAFVPARHTSQTCSRCGHREKSNRNGELFRCKKCSFTLDADYNASLNILSVGLGSLESPISKSD